uniref:Uncharacterized protein n=1 Tax=Prymnesium polylepis TaxID=72548 RepID=A0A7S4I6M5_9EUKA
MQARPEEVPLQTVEAVEVALRAYVPSEGGTEATLLDALAHALPPSGLESPIAQADAVQTAIGPADAGLCGAVSSCSQDGGGPRCSRTRACRAWPRPSSSASPEGDVSMRVVELQHAVRAERWDSRRARRRPAVPTHTVQQADIFVSHAHADGAGRKARMLLEYLCLHAFYARTLTVGLVLALFLLPMGFAVHDFVPSFSPWLLSTAVGMAAGLLLVWSFAGLLGAVPAQLTPWSLSGVTLFIDCFSISQECDESVQAGAARIGLYVRRSQRMVAFASPTFWGRLWCVYELATFCQHVLWVDGRLDTQKLGNRLVLLSPDWPATLNPFKGTPLSERELVPLRGFKCADARCHRPSDRALLLSAIRRDWGSLEAFESFVRVELVRVFELSRQRYNSQLCRISLDTANLLLGDG